MPNKIHFNFNSLKKIKAPGLSECFSAWYRWTIYRERSNQMLRIIKKKKNQPKSLGILSKTFWEQTFYISRHKSISEKYTTQFKCASIAFLNHSIRYLIFLLVVSQ